MSQVPSAGIGREFGSFIRKRRESMAPGDGGKPPTQEELASLVGLQKSAFSKYELGAIADISPTVLAKFAEALKLDYFEAALRLAHSKYRRAEDSGDTRWDLLLALAKPSEKTSRLDVSEEVQALLAASQGRAQIALRKDHLVLDIEGLATWEEHLEGKNNFWIVTNKLFDGTSQFMPAVLRQLKQGSRYTFFVPPTLVSGIDVMLRHRLETEVENPAIRAIPIKDEDAFRVISGNAYVLANAFGERKCAFVCPLVDGQSLQLAYHMENPTNLVEFLNRVATDFAGEDREMLNHLYGNA